VAPRFIRLTLFLLLFRLVRVTHTGNEEQQKILRSSLTSVKEIETYATWERFLFITWIDKHALEVVIPVAGAGVEHSLVTEYYRHLE
jgi:hypothetical protein